MFTMSRRFSLTRSLTRVSRIVELHPGQTYIVRFKSAGRNYKTDIWIAILLPDSGLERFGLHRRPKGAKPLESVWNIPTDERSYPCFLPARNTFRYSSVEELYELPRRIPKTYVEVYGEKNANLFRRLLNIARLTPGVDFWVQMARKETLVKGKRGKEMELIESTGYANIFNSSTADSDQESPLTDTSGEEYRPGGPDLTSLECPKGKGRTKSFTQFGLGTPSLSQGNDMIGVSYLPIHGLAPIKQENQVGDANQRDLIFGMNLRQILSNLLLKNILHPENLYVLRSAIDIQYRPEAEKICSYLKTNEFNPRVIHVSDSTFPMMANQMTNSMDEKQTRLIEDLSNIGQWRQLEGINDSDDLSKQIMSLGSLYKEAQNFDMTELIDLIVLKLHIAWNSYPGLHQLHPLVETIRIINPEHFTTPLKDPFQKWIVNFIAETLDLFQYACGKRFWEIMKSYPFLYSAASEKRKKLIKNDQEKYVDLRVLLQSRGVEI